MSKNYLKKEIELKKIILDDQNPRLFMTVRREGETIAEQMLRTVSPRQMINLMNNIIQEGELNPSTIFSVIESRGNYVVLDGNRRSFAIALLSGALKTENDEINRFIDMNGEKIKKFLEETKTVSATIYSNRDAAMKWIDMNHLISDDGISTLKWETFARRVASKESFALAFWNILIEEKIEPISFKVTYTVFERLFGDKDIRKELSISKVGTITSIGDKDNFIRFVHFINNKSFSVQDVFTKEQKIYVYNSFAKSNKDILNETSKSASEKELKSYNNTRNQKLPHDDVSITGRYLKVTPIKQVAVKSTTVLKKKSELEELSEKLIKENKQEKISILLKQIKNIDFKKNHLLISLAIRPIFEIAIDHFCSTVLKKDDSWFKNKDGGKELPKRALPALEYIINNGVGRENKNDIEFIKRDVSDFLKSLNYCLHSPFELIARDVDINLKRVLRLVEELWKKF